MSHYGGVQACTCASNGNFMDWNTLTKRRIRKKSWNVLSNFSEPEKGLENGDKVWKNSRKSLIFFSKLQQLVLYKWFFFVLVKSYSISPVCLQPIMVMKKAFLFLRFLRCLLINDLFDNFESGKRNYCFVKKSGKSLEYIFWYMCKAKKDHLGISESKARMLERTEKNCSQACLHWVPRRTSMRTQASRHSESR